ncbi:Eco57I restriction-modification methylase domain-containing protein [Streptococcus suis]|uniref:Eco57I restriction-modification methylase domain-containing protein n=1 Tax=Streptococcus suis TaxID=1307 RepID=UPI000406F37B|nr:N-6 DNA methylase [Streptococcus suis]
MKLNNQQLIYLDSKEYLLDLEESISRIKSQVHQTDNESMIASAFEKEIYLFLLTKLGVPDNQKKEFTQTDFGFEFSGRIDMMDGGLLVEYKRPAVLTSGTSQEKAQNQLVNYYKQLRDNFDITLMIVTDGKKVSEIVENIDGIRSTPFKELDVLTFDRIIKAIIASDSKQLNSYNIVRDFSLENEDSLTKRISNKLYSILSNSDENDQIDILHREWQELFHLSEADMGKNQDIAKRREALSALFKIKIDTPKAEYRGLFALQTTYAIIVKLIACKIVHRVFTFEEIKYFSDLTSVEEDQLHRFLQKMEDGYSFADQGIHNLLEGDFFSWYVWDGEWDYELFELIKELVTRIEDYSIFGLESNINSADIFKDLYIEIMPKAVRHSLGEYFTPAWLADSLLKEAVSQIKNDESYIAVDPTCGSGVFLITMIQSIIAKNDIVNYTNQEKKELLEQILHRVKGIDINPLSVLTSRVGYILAVSPLLTKDVEFEIPVYLGDSAVTPTKESIGNVECFRYDMSSIQSEINAVFPVKLVEDQDKFSKVIRFLAKMAQEGNEELLFRYLSESVESYVGTLDPMLEVRFRDMIDQMIALDKNSWNGLWIKVIGNFIKITTIKEVDIVVGNPPWVKWEFLPSAYAERIKSISIDRHLFSGQTYMGAISLNICALIAHVTATNFLKKTGVLAFLMPKTILTQDSYEGFRNFIIDEDNGERFYLQKCIDWEKSGHPFMDMKDAFLSYIYKRDYVDYKQGLPLEFVTKKRGSKKMSVINLEHSFESVKSNFDFVEGKLIQVDSSRSGFTFVRDGSQAEHFSKIVGYCSYKARSGVEFTPKEVYMLIEEDDNTSSNKSNWIFQNDTTKGTVHKVNHSGPLKIETKYVRPLIKGPMISKFNINWQNEYAIYPYNELETTSVPIVDLYNSSNRLAEYLVNQKDVIGAQSERSKAIAKGDDFYSLSKIGVYTYAPYKVVFRDNSDWAAAVLGPMRTSWGDTVTAIPAKHAPYFSQRKLRAGEKVANESELYITQEEAYYICGVLNAPVVKNYMLSTFSTRSISIDLKIKLPLYDESDPNHKKISDLVKSIYEKNIVDESDLLKLNEYYLNICNETE